jgi:Dolichyl-phosphate-mannose-protein mannosyltransferase
MTSGPSLQTELPPESVKESDEVVPPSRRSGGSTRRNSSMSYVVLGMSIGVFLIAVSFAASRANNAHANIMYWIGEFAFFAVPTTYLLTQRPSKRQSTLLAFATPLLSYAITESYSPIQFRFLDEFQHVQTAQAILQTHHLFTSNTSLPVSPYFPGLEIATTALAQLSHLSIYASGTIVVGIIHLLTAVGLYLLVMEIYNRPRIAALSVIIYATEPHYQFFDAYFTYETMAMPFLIACLVAYVKMMKAPAWRTQAMWLGLALYCGAVTAVSHHITSYVLLAFLVVLTIGEGARRSWPRRGLWWSGALSVAVFGLIAAWDLGVAHGVLRYLEPAAHAVSGTSSVATQQLGGGNLKDRTGLAVSAPERDVLAEYASTALLLGLVSLGIWFGWRNRRIRTHRLRIMFMLLSASVFGVVLVRLGASDGSELAGRSYSFAMIPGSVACAFALQWLFVPRAIGAIARSDWWRRLVRLGCGVALVLILAIGGIAGGWPEYYARLPGPFLASAWERSVDSRNLLAAEWAADNIPKGSGVASNWVTGGLMGSLGHLSNDQGTALLFLTTEFTPQLGTIVAQRRVRYIVVDSRTLTMTPQSGAFFDNDPFAGSYKGGLRLKQLLNKFNVDPGISKIYSDGTISIYDLYGSEYKP